MASDSNLVIVVIVIVVVVVEVEVVVVVVVLLLLLLASSSTKDVYMQGKTFWHLQTQNAEKSLPQMERLEV